MGAMGSLKTTSPLVHVLMALFGMRAWVDLAGIWVEMPLLVERLPEAWQLSSYVSVVLQISNIGLVLYVLGNALAPRHLTDTRAIKGMYIIGGVACLLLAFFWDKTSVILYEEHSTALLVITLFMGAMACSSSVVFLTFVSKFKSPYVTPMFAGQGLGQFLSSLVALAQGVGNTVCQNVTASDQDGPLLLNRTQYSLQPVHLPPRFNSKEFFFIVFGLEVVSALAFFALVLAPVCKRELATSQERKGISSEPKRGCLNKPKCASTNDLEKNTNTGRKSKTTLSKSDVILVVLLAGWGNGFWNGALRSIQTYACLPFGITTYHLAVTLAEAANPLACFLAMFVPTTSKKFLVWLTLFHTAVGCYVIVTASLSPNPPLVDYLIGDVIAVACQVAMAGFVTYTKVCIAGLCREAEGRAGLWFGVVIQGGALIGAVVAFLLVSVYSVFQSAQSLCD